MKIEITPWGRVVTIPETSVNSEFSFRLREVRKINNNEPREQELINRLEVSEKKAIRKLTILLFSMENFFKQIAEDKKEVVMLSIYGRSETEWTGTNGITGKRTPWRKKLTAIPLSMPTNQSTDGVFKL